SLNQVYVGSAPTGGSSSGQVFVLKGSDHSIVAQFSAGSPSSAVNAQSYIAVDDNVDLSFPDPLLYVANFNGNDVTIFRLSATSAVPIAIVGTGAGPPSVAVNPVTHRVYVGNTGDTTMTLIDGISKSVAGTLSLPMRPAFLAVDAAESRIYVSS